MEHSINAKKKLESILQTQDFQELDQFMDENQWDSLSREDRHLLARLFFVHGKAQLDEQNSRAYQTFRNAVKANPSDPNIYFEIAKFLTSRALDQEGYRLALEFLEASTEIDPSSVECWSLWGKVLTSNGLSKESLESLSEAQEKYQFAVEHSKNHDPLQQAVHYWDWGLCCYYQGKLSGEASDYHLSLSQYKKAHELGLDEPNFWNDYGNSSVNLSMLIRHYDLFTEAKGYFEKAVLGNPSHFEAWTSLGVCYQQEYEHFGDDAHFEIATASFERATQLNSNIVVPWIKWAQLLGTAAKMHHDADKLHLSSERFAKADELMPNHPVILGNWAEVQMLYGSFTDQLRFLHEAEQKIVRAIEIDPNTHILWYLYGACLNELGHYFKEEKYFRLAIEKLQHGLKLNRTDPHLWYALAMSHFSLGEKQLDKPLLEQANKICSHVMEFGRDLYPQFWNDWGVVLMKLGEATQSRHYYEEAVDKFERALFQETLPVRAEWLYNYGCALDFLGDFSDDPTFYEKSIEVLQKVLQVDPEFSNARYNLALAYSHLGELTGTVEAFQRAIEHFEILVLCDNEDDNAWNDWGTTLMHYAQLIKDPSSPEEPRQFFAEAESKFSQALALGNVTAFYNLACLHSLNGQYDAAMHYILRAEATASLPSFEDMKHDEWLEGLRHTAAFRDFISQKFLDKSL